MPAPHQRASAWASRSRRVRPQAAAAPVAASRRDGGEVVVSLEGLVPYRSYVLERAVQPGDWQPLWTFDAPAGPAPGEFSTEEWREAPTPAGRAFFRLRWTEP